MHTIPAPTPAASTPSDPNVVVSHPATRRRATWAWWGAAAGVLCTAGTLVDGAFVLEEDDYLKGAGVIELVDRTQYHVGIVTGLAGVLCLLVAAAGWRRWAEDHAPRDLAARMASLAMTASAGAMMLAYGFKGSMAVYLDGGMDEGSHTAEGLYSVFMFLDFAPFMAFWGVLFAAAALAWVSIRHGLLPRWLGAATVPFVALPVVVVAATGLPGLPALCGLWLVGFSAAVALRREPARP